MKSIRRFLTWRLLVATAALFVSGNATLYLILRSRIVGQFDDAMAAKARAFASMLVPDDGGIELEFKDEYLPEYGRPDRPEYFQIWIADGEVVERSKSMNRNQDLPRRAGTLGSPLHWDMELPDGRRGRAVGILVGPEMIDNNERDDEDDEDDDEDDDDDDEGCYGQGASLHIVLARGRGELSALLWTVFGGLVLLSGLAVAAILVVIPPTVRLGLKPLGRFGDKVAVIDSRSMDSRFDVASCPAELRPIAGRLNELMDRLETAFRRERRLTADIAHELKTPLAELRSLGEVALKWPEDEHLARDAVANAVEIARQMDRIVSTLLALGRCGNGRQAVNCTTLNVAETLAPLLKRCRTRAEAREITVSVDIADDANITTDKMMFSSIVENVLSNAADYCPAAGRITIDGRNGAGGLTLSVTNTSTSLTAADVGHVFEPMWRKDPARSDGSHVGLGLTLVAAFADVLGMDVRAEIPSDSEFRVTVVSPARPDGAEPGER